MKSVILNSPYLGSNRHFKSDDRGITDMVLEFRWPSSFYIPFPCVKTKEKQLELNITEVEDRWKLNAAAYYDTHTLLGKAYWYLCLPFHHFIFGNLIKEIEKRS